MNPVEEILFMKVKCYWTNLTCQQYSQSFQIHFFLNVVVITTLIRLCFPGTHLKSVTGHTLAFVTKTGTFSKGFYP
jgi:hypothetical protein